VGFLNKILDIPVVWDLSQAVLGCNRQKRKIYRSIFSGPGRLLDFGCANGNTFLAFTDFEYYGLDINTNLIEQAKKKYSSFDNAHFINDDIFSQSFALGDFDFVLFAGTAHHLSDEMILKVMAKLGEALRPGGRIYFFDSIREPDRESSFLKFLLDHDQGKFTRNRQQFDQLMGQMPDVLQLKRTELFEIKGALMPQPRHFFAELHRS